MVHRQWWQRPRLRTDEEEHRERRVSWLELFFDLVFVVVIAELANHLAGHVSVDGLLGFMILFLPVWWVWIGGIYYNERFETEDISYRLFVFLQMLPIAALAVFVHDGLGTTSVQFAISYAVVRIMLILMWLRGGWHEPRSRPVTNRYALGFTISVLLFLASTLIAPPLRFLMWGIGMALDVLTPVTTLRYQAHLPRFSTSRLPERYGLFVLIVLGETIVRAVHGIAERGAFTLVTAGEGTLGLGLAFGLWWVYFDFVARRPPRPGVWWSLFWGYLHLPLVMGIVAIGAGISNVLAHHEETLAAPDRWLSTGAVAVTLITIGLLELVLRRDPDEPTNPRVSAGLKFAGALLALALGWLGGGTGRAALLAMLLLSVLIQIIYGTYVWYRPVASRQHQPLEAVE